MASSASPPAPSPSKAKSTRQNPPSRPPFRPRSPPAYLFSVSWVTADDLQDFADPLADEQNDLSVPFWSMEAATQAATEIVPVSPTSTRHELISPPLRLARSIVIAFSSLYLGILWGEDHQRSKRRSRNCDIVRSCHAPSSRSSSASPLAQKTPPSKSSKPTASPATAPPPWAA